MTDCLSDGWMVSHYTRDLPITQLGCIVLH